MDVERGSAMVYPCETSAGITDALPATHQTASGSSSPWDRQRNHSIDAASDRCSVGRNIVGQARSGQRKSIRNRGYQMRNMSEIRNAPS